MRTMTSTPDIHSITIQYGIAGQISASLVIQYPMDDLPSLVALVGNAYGGPVTMVMESGAQITVDSVVRDRIDQGGTFSIDPESWARRFFS